MAAVRIYPKDGNTATLVPIQKRCNRMTLRAYRPIVVLSHVRKVIERTIAMIVHAQYMMSDNQLGFRQRTGIETARLRHINNAITIKLSTVLDL